jgi:hypothetical protein
MAGASIAMKILTSPAGCRRRPLYDCRLARALVTVPPPSSSNPHRHVVGRLPGGSVRLR